MQRRRARRRCTIGLPDRSSQGRKRTSESDMSSGHVLLRSPQPVFSVLSNAPTKSLVLRLDTGASILSAPHRLHRGAH